MNVLLLTQENCHFCDMAKALLDRLALEYHFEIETLELNSPEGQTLAEQNGVLFPPGLFIDGEAVSYGRPSEGKLRRELRRRLNA